MLHSFIDSVVVFETVSKVEINVFANKVLLSVSCYMLPARGNVLENAGITVVRRGQFFTAVK